MSEYRFDGNNRGALAAALAKAQAAFPPIPRDKTVTVQTKTGGSYTFNYAPLDTILAAVRKPLSDNGLAITQLIDSDALVTLLMHESGGVLEGRTTLPANDDVQRFGSAITYLRRYAIQAALGIAAEEDDDGNHAAGNTVTVKPDVEQTDDGGLIGTVQVGDRQTSDYSLRQTPEDGYVLGFRLRGGRGGILVRAKGALAEQLAANREAIVGQRVTCWGQIANETFTPKGGRKVFYEVLDAVRVRVAGMPDMPMAVTEPNPNDGGPELFSEDEDRAIAAALA